MKNLNMMTPIGYTGYGVAGYNILKTLKERDWNIALFNKGNNRQSEQLVKECIAQATMFHHDAPCLQIWHQFDLANKIGRGEYFVFPFFELDTFNDNEKHHMGYADKIIVSSQWAKDVVLNNGISSDDRVFVVPLGVDPQIFNPFCSDDHIDGSPTIFLNCGKWEVRKGHDFLIDVFHQAFSVDDNVELWMLPHNPFLSAKEQKNWEDMYVDSPMGKAGKVRIWPWQKTHDGVAQIMAAANCGVFPSRAEGWNLELLEMMAMGKHLIATNYSAHTEFCNDDNCLLIDCPDMVPAFDGRWFFEQGNWASMEQDQFDQLANHMKTVHMWIQENGVDISRDRKTFEEFSWDATADKMEKILT